METVSSAPRIRVSTTAPTVQDVGFQSLAAQGRHTGTMKQSRPLPRWLWYIIAKSLGIKTNPTDKPWFATLLYILTLITGTGYFITNTWYTIADIVSENTTFDSLNGTVNIMLSISFCAVSVYANDLAYRLFTNRLFLQSVRLHTKTFLKVNTAFIIGLLGLMFIALYNYENRKLFSAEACVTLRISPWMCHVQYPCLIGVTVFSFLWNMLVAVVCLSVCRTHTISVRHFLLELDEDAMICHINNYHKRRHSRHHNTSSCGDHMDGATNANVFDSTATAAGNQSLISPTSEEIIRDLEDEWDMNEYERRRISVSRLHHTSVGFDSVDGDHTNHEVWSYLLASGKEGGRQATQSESELPSPFGAAPGELRILDNREILEKYWRLQCRLRTTSHCIQRWLLSWMVLLIAWSVVYLLYWISHEASITDMFLFLLPLAILPLLCAAPTEVNGEGHKVPKSICPTEDRLRIISFIKQSPLSLTVFGFELSYTSVFTTIVAIALAFATKIILQDVSATSQMTSSTIAPNPGHVVTPSPPPLEL